MHPIAACGTGMRHTSGGATGSGWQPAAAMSRRSTACSSNAGGELAIRWACRASGLAAQPSRTFGGCVGGCIRARRSWPQTPRQFPMH
eukprot:scaffold29718_cov109-Isochrysis_galbana.AAC.2